MKTFQEFILECGLVEGKVPWDDPGAPLKSGWTPREKNRAKRISTGVENPEHRPTEKELERYGNLDIAHKTQSNIKQPKAKKSHQYKTHDLHSRRISRYDIRDDMTRAMFSPTKTELQKIYNLKGPEGLKEPK